MRRTLGLVTAFSVALCLTGCSVPARGWTAIGRDARGHLIGVVQLCGGHVDGVTVYRSSGDSEEPDRTYTFAHPVRSTVVVRLPGTLEMMRRRSRSEWTIYAFSKDDSTSAPGPSVHLTRLDAVPEGQVLGPDAGSESRDPALSTIARFRASVLRHCADFG